MPAKIDLVPQSFASLADPQVLKNALISPLSSESNLAHEHVSNGHSATGNGGNGHVAAPTSTSSPTLLEKFVHAQKELEAYR